MSTFHSANDMNMSGGSISVVQGNQNHYYARSQSSERSLVRFRPGDEWKEMLYQEYERISLGKIKLLKTLCREPLVAPRGRRIMVNSGKEGYPEAERVVEIASIVDGRRESLPLLTIRYAGRDAKELFKKDCIHFALQRASTMPQFRAFNDSNIPMIIFSEELVSASHSISHNLYSFHAQCYLHLQARSSALRHAVSDVHPASVIWPFEPYSLIDLAWFRPLTGVLCFGPRGPYPKYEDNKSSFSSCSWGEVKLDSQFNYDRFELPPLPLNICTDTTFLNHVMHNVPERSAVCTMSSATICHTTGPVHRGVCDWKERLTAESSWTRELWAKSEDFSRLVLKPPPSYHWLLRGCEWLYGVREHEDILTEKGGMRFMITRRPINQAAFLLEQVSKKSYRTRERKWLLQAGSIFGRLRVPRERWSSAAIFRGFKLQLSSDVIKSLDEIEREDWNEDLGPPCYLFLPSPPRLPNGDPDIEAWLRRENLYYYSYDPEGGSAITEQDRIALGLPSYTGEVYVEYAYWEADAYEFMEQWQKTKGFDYSTADYAESLGFSILEGIPEGELRYEDLIGAQCEEVLPDNLMDVDSESGSTRDNSDIPPTPPPAFSFSPSFPGEEGSVTFFGLGFHVDPPGFGLGGGAPPDVDEPGDPD
ncbi:hypothetical protein PM082_016761 [Marasmius tenuissimus]|nr:hypothetical protein PM082_016761 [Marasmius tenuissimus]